MKHKRGTSVSVALAELNALEEERLSNEQREREGRRRKHQEAMALAAERNRRVEEERLRAEEQRRQQEEEARRFEEARIEAMQRAELERVRAEVEVRARTERERRAHAQAVELEKARAAASKGHRRWVLGSCALGLLGLGTASTWLGVKVGALETQLVHAAAMSATEHDAYEDVLRDLDSARREAKSLRKRLDATIGSSPYATPSASGVGPVGPALPSRKGPLTRPAPASVTCTNDGDPMNGCLSR